jgi:adenylosuccinate synthase
MDIKHVDICVGLAWGDEAKGKITAQLCKTNSYDFVCRWAGGNNAGHTIYVNHNKYVTNLIPSGVFYGVKSIIGPDCVVNIDSFLEEIQYLKTHNFDTTIVKISPKAHIVTKEHINEDLSYYTKSQGSTSKGIAPCYRDKYARIGKRVEDYSEQLKDYIWDEELYGNILCEGAQGYWLDINMGNYPFVTSSNTLPYSACSLGFPPQCIRNIYGAAKLYDTRVGKDPEFPDTLFDNLELSKLGNIGQEYGATTGRKRKVNWLNLDKLIKAINISGTNILILSKADVIKELNIFKYISQNKLKEFNNYDEFLNSISSTIQKLCSRCFTIHISDNPFAI